MPEPSSHLQLTPPELSYCWEEHEKKKYAPFAYPQPVCGGCADRLGHVRQAESTLIVQWRSGPLFKLYPVSRSTSSTRPFANRPRRDLS